MSGFFGSILYQIYSVVNDFGWAIVIFTVLTKLVLLPLNIKQTKAMKETNKLQPMIKELQEKYKNDKETLSKKQMELYKEHNINPLASCLPMLIQFPLIIALFAVLRDPATHVFQGTGVDYETISRSFLWIKDLSLPDVPNAVKQFFDADGVEIASEVIRNGFYILPVLSAVTSFFQTQMIKPPTNPGGPQTNNMMMTYMFPLMIGYFSLKFSAGLALYWVVGNIFTIIQQFAMSNEIVMDKIKKVINRDKGD